MSEHNSAGLFALFAAFMEWIANVGDTWSPWWTDPERWIIHEAMDGCLGGVVEAAGGAHDQRRHPAPQQGSAHDPDKDYMA